MSKMIAIIPGNGGGDVFTDMMWYKWAGDKLRTEIPDHEIKLTSMPDPVVARESIWIPYMRDELKIGEDSVIVGHSSGAVAAIRFCEKYKVKGIVLVSAYTTDCGLENERLSGYFDRPWDWEKVKQNTDWIIQFGSKDDPFLAWNEQVEVSVGLNAEFHQYDDKGHFMDRVFPDLVTALKKKITS